jgi:hypothetical protein
MVRHFFNAICSAFPRRRKLAAVDWTAPEPKSFLAMRHVSGGEVHLSVDGGESWKPILKEEKINALEIFDATALVLSDGAGDSAERGSRGWWRRFCATRRPCATE